MPPSPGGRRTEAAAGQSLRGPIATMRSIGMRACAAISGGTLTSPAHVAQRVAQLRQRDHLHVLAEAPRLAAINVDVRRRLLQRVEHARLGGDDEGSPGPGCVLRRSSSIPPVESMWTPSASMSPAATYSITESSSRTRGGSGTRRSGCSARIVGDVVGADAGVDVALAVPDVDAAVPGRLLRRRRRGTCRGRRGSRCRRRARARCARRR